MDFFSFLTLFGGLALFLYGMTVMGDGLSRMAGGKLESVLERLTSKRIYAVLLGAGVTAVIQSSSATTVMVVGFVNSGIMQLSQAVGIIMGANVGTTVTSWILSLTGIQGTNFWIRLLKPSSFSPVLAVIGIILMMFNKEENKKKDIGAILLGFAILMFGMETMSSSVSPLAESEKFAGIMTAFSNPILGMIAGAVLTAVIQSSSASVGILQALAATGAVNYSVALPIIMGQNIGTCVTAIISSIGAGKNAKRASLIHLFFNLIGTVLFMVVFYTLNHFLKFAFLGTSANAAGIAVIHSLFNIGCCIVFYPFADLLVKLATLAVPEHASADAIEDESEKSEENFCGDITLDERFLERPAFAMEICRNMTRRMAEESKEAVLLALDMILKPTEKKKKKIARLEQRCDRYEDVLGSYLVKLSGQTLSKEDSKSLSVMLHSISDFERLSDHAINLSEEMEEMADKKIEFSKSASEELKVMIEAMQEIVTGTVVAFNAEETYEAARIEPLEQVIDGLTREMKDHHIKRLRKGKCTIELGLILEDILTNLERISDHCSNIAVEMLTIDEDGYDTHEYFEEMDDKRQQEFSDLYHAYKKKYRLDRHDDKMKKKDKKD